VARGPRRHPRPDPRRHDGGVADRRQGLLELREEVADIVDLQVVAFPQDGIFTDPTHEDLLREALEMGADVVGAIPHNEHTREDGVASVQLAMDLAERYDGPRISTSTRRTIRDRGLPRCSPARRSNAISASG